MARHARSHDDHAHDPPDLAHAPHTHDHGHDQDHADHDHDHDHGGHDHGPSSHDHAHDLRRTPQQRLTWAFGLTATFLVAEAAVGWWSQSLALLADAGHMLADAAALGLALFAQRVASRGRTPERTYGHRRAEVLAAFANGTLLALTSVWIVAEAVERWQQPPEIRGGAMLVTAALGLVVNLGSAAILHRGDHNANTRAALAHVLSDAVGSIGAIVAGALVWGWGVRRADPVTSALIAVLVAYSGYRLVRDTTRVLMEGTPGHIDVKRVEAVIRGVPGVADMHDLHVWTISDGFDALTVHVVLTRGSHGTEVAASVGQTVRATLGITHVTVQPEPPRADSLIPLRRRP